MIEFLKDFCYSMTEPFRIGKKSVTRVQNFVCAKAASSMTMPTCPDHQTLQQFLLGKTPASNTELIAKHLATCSICAATAETLHDGNDLTEAIARSVQADATPLEVDTVVLKNENERAKLLSGLSKTQTGGASPTHTTTIATPNAGVTPSAGHSKIKKHDLSFLGPARQPDELGRLGDYRILKLLGVGGMGMVFKAEDIRLGRLVALKVMLPHIAASPESKARFLREARATAALSHDHIVQIHQVGADRGVPFIAMQYLEGRSLQAASKRLKKLRGVDIARIGKQVASGLAAAHEKGLIHRDIKPDNIWIEAKTGRVKILDFGLARNRNIDTGLTQSGTILGTPRYMAPEQITGETVDHRADLYSLGSMLYHLAAGQPAFTGSSITPLLFSITQATPRPLQELAPQLDPQLANLIMCLLSKQPQDRPESAQATARKFARIEADMVLAANSTAPSIAPIIKKPQPGIRPGRKPPNRRWPLVAAGAAAFALLLGTIMITIRSPDGSETTINVSEGTSTSVRTKRGS
ncbi:MAG: serine/threonine protein kinase [Planctomycetaceae bacterium]|nr:MAG: serine/threonine protein kinase [Planctomycetaceae bacterium]